MPYVPLYNGEMFWVGYWVPRGTRNEIGEFLDELDQSSTVEAKKFFALIKRTGDWGDLKNPQKNKPVEGPIWELRSHQVRFLYVRRANRLIGMHIVSKKKDNLNRTDVDKALSRYQEFLEWETSVPGGSNG